MDTTNERAAPARPGSGSKNTSLGGERKEHSQQHADVQPVFIGDLQKNQRERIRIQLRQYRGTDLCDVRVYYPSEDGSFLATGKGIAFKPALLPELINLLQKATREARVRGLIPESAP